MESRNQGDYERMSKPKDYSWMTKDKLMTYTFFSLLILTVITAALWSTETTPSGWNLGLTLGINAIIAVGIAVGLDAFLHKVAVDSPLNLMSAAVFGLIVTDSYSLGVPVMRTVELFPLEAPQCFVYVALMSVIGLVIFKKIVGTSGRKYVNPAAAAKLVVMIPFINTLLIAIDHLKSSALGVPSLAGPIGLIDPVKSNGLAGFGNYVIGAFSNASLKAPAITTNNLLQEMFLDKFHGWPGGASTIAVIVVGIAFFVVARRYIKWRITVSYLLTAAIMALLLAFAYGDTDMTLRLLFTLFIGSSIFLAFFMATDPATTPLTYTGQIIFGVGLAILTVLMQTYMQFFGASFVALVIMNLTVPALDKVGRLKPTTETKEPKLPKAKAFAPEKVKEYQCIRCGACMRVCCHKLSPILIKQAFDKMDVETMSKLNADYCTGCGHCSYVCPSRIDLKGSVLRSKAMLRQQ
jgi:Na+-translocating ferredoxin:NAD+ oxidoreductase RnfD subunit/NAD-dependent dihydropyrimidine dehydrogenase PreA subunit